jgi:outer membrane protein assembly factor BamB
MTLFRLFTLAAGLSLLAASAACAQSAIDSGDLNSVGYHEYWNIPAQLNASESVTGGFLVDDTIYLVTDHGDLHAVQSGVGLLRWSLNVTDPVYQVFEPSHFTGENGVPLAVISASPRTVIVDRLRGETIADMQLDRATGGPAVADANAIYFGSLDGHMYSMVWNDPRTETAIFKWKALAGGPVTSMPALVNNGDDLVFASQGGSVFSCTAAAKVLNWVYETEGPITGDVVVDGTGTYVASTDRSLYRLDTMSGVRRWRVRFPKSLNEGPTVASNTVYQYCDGEGVTALNADTGQKLWNNPEARKFVCRSAERVYFVTADHRLLAVDAADGRMLRTAALRTGAVPIRNPHDDTIYFATARGNVLCAKPIGTPYLTAAQIERARRELYKPPAAAGNAGETKDGPKPPSPDNRVDVKDPLKSKSDVPPVGGGR